MQAIFTSVGFTLWCTSGSSGHHSALRASQVALHKAQDVLAPHLAKAGLSWSQAVAAVATLSLDDVQAGLGDPAASWESACGIAWHHLLCAKYRMLFLNWVDVRADKHHKSVRRLKPVDCRFRL